MFSSWPRLERLQGHSSPTRDQACPLHWEQVCGAGTIREVLTGLLGRADQKVVSEEPQEGTQGAGARVSTASWMVEGRGLRPHRQARVHLKVLLPRQSPNRRPPAPPELLQALGARLNTTAGFSHHFHPRRRIRRLRGTNAGSGPTLSDGPAIASPRRPAPLARWAWSSAASPEVRNQAERPARLGRAFPHAARVGPCLGPRLRCSVPTPTGSESPPRLPQPSLSCKLLENSFPSPAPRSQVGS